MLGALLSLGLASLAGDKFAEQIERLSAPEAEVRSAAERWLSANLTARDYSAFAAAARAGDAEVRGRLARILGADGRHLTLAVELALESEPALAALGSEATRTSVARAEPLLAEPAVRENLELLLGICAAASPPRYLQVDASLSVEGMLEELELAGELPLGLTLDASVATKTFRRGELLPPAPWNQVLLRLRSLGVGLEFHGLERERGLEAPLGVFVHFTSEAGASRTGVDLVCEWLYALVRSPAQAERVRAAHNLAATGSALLLEWMEERVRTRGDSAALEGLLRAAPRGQVARVLSAQEVLGPLLTEAERGGPRSAHILLGLARVGCFDNAGASLAARFLTELPGATPSARWVRLFVLERSGCADPAFEEAARALLLDPATPAPVALEALFVSALGPVSAPSGVAALPALFGAVREVEDEDRLGRVLLASGLPPPFSDPAVIPEGWADSARLALLSAWLWAERADVAGAHCADWIRRPETGRMRGEALVERLTGFLARGRQAFVEDTLRVAASRLPESRKLTRVRVLLGLASTEELETSFPSSALAGTDDLAVLGALAGTPTPSAARARARELLRTAVTEALKENRPSEKGPELLRALERALQDALRDESDTESQAFAGGVLKLLRQAEKSALGRAVERQAWPRVPGVETRDLGRVIAAFEVPSP